MKYLKQEKKKSKLPLMIGVLVAFLAAAAAGVWFFGTKMPAEQSSPEDDPMTAVEIQTPYGDLLLEGDWVSCLRYEVTQGDVTELNFSAEIAGAHVKLFDLYLGSAENPAGYLIAASGEKIPVGVVVHDIVPGQDWSEEDRELAFTMQDALNTVLAQLKVESVVQDVQEETEAVGTEVFVETGFGVLSYTDFWDGGLRLAEEEGRISGFGTVPGKAEQKLFTISVGGAGEVPAGMYTDQNGQQIPVFLTVPELTQDADWTEEEQRALYAMQNVLNDLLDQLQLTPAEQPQETQAPLADVVVTTSYGTISYPGSYGGKLRIAQDYSNGYRLRAYATMPGKTEVHLFDILIGVSGDVYAGVLKDQYGNHKEVYLNVSDLQLEEGWSEEERAEVYPMQELVNQFCEQLSVDREAERTPGTAAAGDVMIWTSYGTLQYPGEYRQKLVTEITGENGNTVHFYAVRSTGERIELFALAFGGTGEACVGRHMAKDGTACEVYITSAEIIPDDSWSDAELETIYSMQEAVNYVLDKMEESGMLVY